MSNNQVIAAHSIQDRSFAPDASPIAALLPVRYEKMGEMVGGYYERVTEPGDIKPALERALAANTLAVLNVETAPKGQRCGSAYLA